MDASGPRSFILVDNTIDGPIQTVGLFLLCRLRLKSPGLNQASVRGVRHECDCFSMV
jgi:hypothetical protein